MEYHKPLKYKDLNDELLSVKEFALKLNIHPNTVRRAIKNGHINAFRVGIGSRSSFRIAKSEIYRMALVNLEDLIKEMK